MSIELHREVTRRAVVAVRAFDRKHARKPDFNSAVEFIRQGAAIAIDLINEQMPSAVLGPSHCVECGASFAPTSLAKTRIIDCACQWKPR